MRRHPPRLIELKPEDKSHLEQLVRSGHTEQRVARRARILLAMANPETVVQELAEHLELGRKTIWNVCRRYEEAGVDSLDDTPRSGRPREISALERVEIEQLACCAPAGIGLHMTHWSTRTLALAAMARGIVSKIAHSTVSLFLRYADLQPHRSRYWKTPTLDETFRKRAKAVLWCYERAQVLAQRGELVICVDEMPNLQALERRIPTSLVRPGQIERREFEYIRHGTVNFLVAFLVHSGQMRGWCLDANDAEHLRPALQQLLDSHRGAHRIHLIWDGGASHIAGATHVLLQSYPHVRVLYTPAHASWLNQAELLLRAFRDRYLKRGDWASRLSLIEHLEESWCEYNRLFAHPFSWSWTRSKMEKWIARHTIDYV